MADSRAMKESLDSGQNLLQFGVTNNCTGSKSLIGAGDGNVLGSKSSSGKRRLVYSWSLDYLYHLFGLINPCYRCGSVYYLLLRCGTRTSAALCYGIAGSMNTSARLASSSFSFSLVCGLPPILVINAAPGFYDSCFTCVAAQPSPIPGDQMRWSVGACFFGVVGCGVAIQPIYISYACTSSCATENVVDGVLKA